MHELEVPYSPEIKFNLVNKYHSEKNVSINKKKHGLTGPLHTILKHHELGEEKPDWYVVQCMSDLNNDCNHIQNERAVSQGVWFWLLNWDRCRSLVDMTEHEAVWIKCQVSLAGYHVTPAKCIVPFPIRSLVHWNFSSVGKAGVFSSIFGSTWQGNMFAGRLFQYWPIDATKQRVLFRIGSSMIRDLLCASTEQNAISFPPAPTHQTR